MKKILAVLLLSIFCVMTVCACDKNKGNDDDNTEVTEEVTKKQADSNLIGRWNEYGIDDDKQLGDYWEFKDGGKGVNGLLDMSFEYSTSDGRLVVTYDEGWGEYHYSYNIDGNILTLQEDGNSAFQYQKQ